jgi:hypothetical protein
MKIKATIQFKPEYFNRTAQATIPMSWHVECVNLDELIGDSACHEFLYADGDTKRQAIDLFAAECKMRFPQGGFVEVQS